MDKHFGIIVIASIVIASSLGYTAFNAVTLEKLELKWNDRGSFDYLTMLNGGILEVCNTSFIPLKFDGLSIEVFYREDQVGVFSVPDTSATATTTATIVQPNTTIEVSGKGKMTSLAGQIVSMYLDTEISGRDLARVDSDEMTVITSIDTTLLGVIPYSVTKQYTGQEFFEIMNGQNDNGC